MCGASLHLLVVFLHRALSQPQRHCWRMWSMLIPTVCLLVLAPRDPWPWSLSSCSVSPIKAPKRKNRSLQKISLQARKHGRAQTFLLTQTLALFISVCWTRSMFLMKQMMLMGVLKTSVCVSPADCQKKNMLGIKRFKAWCVIWLCVKNCWFRVMWQHRPRNVSAESRNARTWVPLRVVPNYFQLGWKQGYIIFRCRNSTDSLCVLIFF